MPRVPPCGPTPEVPSWLPTPQVPYPLPPPPPRPARPCGAAPGSARAPASAATSPSHVSVLNGDQVVQILDETVDWYRTLGAQQQSATQPSDLLILYANQQTADKVIGLAFEIARANSELLSSEASSEDTGTDATSSAQVLSEQQNKLDSKLQDIQKEIAEDQKLVAGGRKDLD